MTIELYFVNYHNLMYKRKEKESKKNKGQTIKENKGKEESQRK